jgi:CRP-like cAMP-binding protein
MGAGIDLILGKLRQNLDLTEHEKAAIRRLPVVVSRFDAQREIVRVGDRPQRSFVIISGLLATSKVMSSGNRAILAVHVPGDMPDLLSLHLPIMDFTIHSISPVTLGYVEHADIFRLCEVQPRVTHALWRTTLLESALYREAVLNVGHRDATTRLAHLLCELFIRLRAAGAVSAMRYRLPITQSDLADITGMSTVHVNRVLRTLRMSGMLTFSRGVVEIKAWENLADLADFDPMYLSLP